LVDFLNWAFKFVLLETTAYWYWIALAWKYYSSRY